MISNYDGSKHLHLGYYEDGFDFEAIAYKHKNCNKWDVFFDSNEYRLDVPKGIKGCYVESFGYKIFSLDVNVLEHDIGVEHFEKWLKNNKFVK